MDSAKQFGHGIVKRVWFYIPGVILAVLDLVERITGSGVNVPVWAWVALLAAAVILGALLTYQELWTENVRLKAAAANDPERRRVATREVLQTFSDSHDVLREKAHEWEARANRKFSDPNPPGYNEVWATWSDATYDAIAGALGRATADHWANPTGERKWGSHLDQTKQLDDLIRQIDGKVINPGFDRDAWLQKAQALRDLELPAIPEPDAAPNSHLRIPPLDP